MTFQQPSAWFLLLLLLLPVIWWRWRRGRQRATLRFSSLGTLLEARSTWAVRVRWVVPALRSVALALLIVCVARPLKGDERARIFAEGIAIQLIVDRSGSMLAMDFHTGRQRTSRLEVVKDVVEEFIGGGKSLPGRPDDLIGLITFATWADTMCPLTLDHTHLVDAVRATEVSPSEQDRATAIGDAIALGVERMSGIDKRRDLGGMTIKSKVMILLTDGESNAGDIDPITAARMAAAFDIRIHTIGAGTDSGLAPVPAIDPFTGQQTIRRIPVSVDEETLREIAEITGGQYFRADDARALEEVYARIDELERTEIEQQRYTDYQEMAVQPVTVGRLRLPPLLTVVLVVLAVELLLANTRFRTLP